MKAPGWASLRLDDESAIWVQELSDRYRLQRTTILRIALEAGLPFVEQQIEKLSDAGLLPVLRLKKGRK